MTDSPPETIFLAHASQDYRRVKEIFDTLLSAGFEPWIAPDSIPPGARWPQYIKAAIQSSRFFLAFISNHSVSKTGFYQRELRIALNHLEERPPKSIYVVPVLLDDVGIPDLEVGTVNLREHQSVKLYGPDEEIALEGLMLELNREMGNDWPWGDLDRFLPRHLVEGKLEDPQLELFPIEKSAIAARYPPGFLERIANYLSFDIDELDELGGEELAEIAFIARITDLEHMARASSSTRFLLDLLPKGRLNYEDIYFDFRSLDWISLNAAIDEHMDDFGAYLDVDRLMDMIESRLEVARFEGFHDYDDQISRFEERVRHILGRTP